MLCLDWYTSNLHHPLEDAQNRDLLAEGNPSSATIFRNDDYVINSCHSASVNSTFYAWLLFLRVLYLKQPLSEETTIPCTESFLHL